MIEYFFKSHELSFLYVSREDCVVCHAVFLIIRQISTDLFGTCQRL